MEASVQRAPNVNKDGDVSDIDGLETLFEAMGVLVDHVDVTDPFVVLNECLTINETNKTMTVARWQFQHVRICSLPTRFIEIRPRAVGRLQSTRINTLKSEILIDILLYPNS